MKAHPAHHERQKGVDGRASGWQPTGFRSEQIMAKKAQGRVACIQTYSFDIDVILLQTYPEYTPQDQINALAAYQVLMQNALMTQGDTYELPSGRYADAAKYLAGQLRIDERACERALRFLAAIGYILKKRDCLTFPHMDQNGKLYAKSTVRSRRSRYKKQQEAAVSTHEAQVPAASQPPKSGESKPTAARRTPETSSAGNAAAAGAGQRSLKKDTGSVARRPEQPGNVPARKAEKPAAAQKHVPGSGPNRSDLDAIMRPREKPAASRSYGTGRMSAETAAGRSSSAPSSGRVAAPRQPAQRSAPPRGASSRSSLTPSAQSADGQQSAEPRHELPRFQQRTRPRLPLIPGVPIENRDRTSGQRDTAPGQSSERTKKGPTRDRK